MYKINSDKTKAITSINCLANICGYFYNAAYGNFNIPAPNNGYNCNHPDCEEIEDGYGCCYSFSCPLAREADEEDCSEFGFEYEEKEFVIIENEEILKCLAK